MTQGLGGYHGTVVVIPTRNRAAIAMNAIRSVLDQSVDNVHVMVSDNSTSEHDREDLADFCSTHADHRLRYVRPPQSLSMSSHWDWAIQQALTFYKVSHFLYLTDRMMFRAGALKEVLDLAALYPDKVITYNHDRIVDTLKPIRIEQYPSTERLLEVQTLRFSYLYSQAILHNGLPRMLNCVVPRKSLDRMQERFGNVFSSISPDFIFCCRCLEIEESILFYDKSPLFHYALNRSNGASVTRGEMTSDNADFTANLPVDNSVRNYATPIPGLITAVNAVFNEYLIFRQETNSQRFFEVDFQKYLQANAEEIREVADAGLRAEMHALLLANGYRESSEGLLAGIADSQMALKSNSIWEKLKRKLRAGVTGPATKPAWIFLARTFGIGPPGENGFEFLQLDEAIDYARNISRGNFKKWPPQHELLLAREMPTTRIRPKEGDESWERSSRTGRIKQALVRLFPLSLKRSIHRRLNKARLARLLRVKKRFRTKRESATPSFPSSPQGVNLVAYIRAEMGLGAVARGMASAFEFMRIPFNVINMERGNSSRQRDYSWSHKESRRSGYDVTIVCVNPDNSFHLRTQVSAKVLGNRYVIGNWLWELPELPDEWIDEFEFTDEIWAASRFIRDAVSCKSPVPVVHIPPVVRLIHTENFSKRQLGLPERRYLFLSMFDTNSVLERKNPLGVLTAFKKAFPNNDPNVGLIMKFNNPDYQQPVLRSVREEMAGQENVFLLDRVMDRDEVNSLIRLSDCFVSLHRSEGFGLGPAEAMSLGKPAIITNWSGNTDYMTEDNSIGIDYELVQLGKDYGPYKDYQYWAEPDLEQATYWMRTIVKDSELARSIGSRAQDTINSGFSPEAVGRIIQRRLEQIRRNE